MCPQTVYMEFVYRPLERLFDGPPGARHSRRRRADASAALKYALLPARVGLPGPHVPGVFRGRRGPGPVGPPVACRAPVSFVVMLAVTGLMLFDFAYFREQMCMVACPYGRFQSVMLDRNR